MTLKEALQQAIDSRSWFDIYAEVSPDGGCFMLDSEASFAEQEGMRFFAAADYIRESVGHFGSTVEQILDEVNADEFPLG